MFVAVSRTLKRNGRESALKEEIELLKTKHAEEMETLKIKHDREVR